MADDLLPEAFDLVERSIAAGMTIATAESCTGGLIAGAITDVPGSSAAFDRGFVTYSNAAKIEMLGVDARLIEDNGAVSPQVAAAMVAGALAHSGADIAVAVTGVAGPDGGTDEKPVGLVYFAAARRGHRHVPLERRYGDIGRAPVRRATIRDALLMLAALMPS